MHGCGTGRQRRRSGDAFQEPRSRATYHLEEGEVSVEYVVEVDHGVVPGEVVGLARVAVGHEGAVESCAVAVDAAVELSRKHLDPHDGEDEPEDEAHQQHVEDGRDGLDEGVDYNLWVVAGPHREERPERDGGKGKRRSS